MLHHSEVIKTRQIYAFYDPRYEIGVTLGVDSSNPKRFRDAQCSAPFGMSCAGVWNFETDKAGIDAFKIKARAGLPALTNPRSGIEWVDLSKEDAVQRISENLSSDAKRDFNPKPTKNDLYFTNNSSLVERGRSVLWIFKENETGILKVTVLSDWQTPLEDKRGYSRLGFAQVAAYLIEDETSQEANNRTYEIHKRIVSEFSDDDPFKFSWLDKTTSFGSVDDFVQSGGESFIRLPESVIHSSQCKPSDVAITYNKPFVAESDIVKKMQSHFSSSKKK
ncbi:hypothetical protein A9Q83_04260 [Alphaproteobacteria bacterium 46_93_T64]|nr:hypothetical protein A9Q83_04260 [Alphaproteobacteria bacterium 46_93_T64]